MRILVLGGTQFVGRYIVKQALANRHTVTLFNRGKTNPDLFLDLERLRGDRDGGLDALRGRTWDAVIDVNGYVPRVVRDSAELLKGAVGHYTYVSTGAVYAIPFPTNGDESSPIKTLDDPTSEYTDKHYGELKALCEDAVREVLPDRALVLRLGLVAGPHDDTDRVTYWVTRVARGGEVLAPGWPENAIQIIDARDFAAFVLLAVEKGITGTYNTTGESTTWGAWFDTFRAVSGSNATFTWIDDRDFLRAHLPKPARPYGSLPLYLPAEWGDWWTNNSDRAQALVLKYRPTSEIARDILEWDNCRLLATPRLAGLTPEAETTILKAWHSRR